MTTTIVALAGPDAAAHDFHAGRAGAFAEAIAALAAARAADVAVTVATPLTRSSYRVLAALPVLLRGHHVARWQLRVLADADVAPAAVARTIPRLAMALPHALHAAERARRLGLPTTIVDAPRCLLGPFAAHAEATAVRGFAAPCASCAARARCPGVDPAYLDRFGADELAAIA